MKEDTFKEEDILNDIDYSTDLPDEKPEKQLEYYRHEGTGESIVEKPTIDNFFNTEQLLQEVEKTMKGYQKKEGKWVYATTPKARDAFINSMMNRLRSVINQQNMISRMEKDEAYFLLLEKNKDFIFSVYDEPSIDDDDVESVINIYDHAMQIFMGQVIQGFGARTLRQIAAAVSYEVDEGKKDESLFSFGVGDTNILSVGGKNK